MKERRMKRIVSLIIACIITAMLCGCAGTKYLPISLEEEKQRLEATKPHDPITRKAQKMPAYEPPQKKGYTIGILMPNMYQDIWASQVRYMRERFAADGHTVIVRYADDNLDLQSQQIDELSADAADCLIIVAVDCAGIAPACYRAKIRGCKVISSDRLISDTKSIDAYVTFNTYETGRLQGEYIAEHLDLSSPKNLEIVSGPMDDINAMAFYDGAMIELKPLIENGQLVVRSGQISFEDTETPRWDYANAQERMEKILDEYYQDERLDAVLAAADCVAYGAMNALDSKGYFNSDEVSTIVTGQDAEIFQVQCIREGFASMTEFLDPIAYTDVVVPVAYAVLKSESLLSDTICNNGLKDVPTYLYNPKVIDKNNLEDLVNVGFYTHKEVFG